MKNLTVKFTVKGNNNYYFATSHKTKAAFCKNEGFEIDVDYDINAMSISDQNRAEKIGRGVYFIDANRHLIV